jgi:hypothetical protein
MFTPLEIRTQLARIEREQKECNAAVEEDDALNEEDELIEVDELILESPAAAADTVTALRDLPNCRCDEQAT